MTRPGAPGESVKSTIKKYILESFSKYTGVSNITKVGWKSVPGGWTGVEKATFTKSCFVLGRIISAAVMEAKQTVRERRGVGKKSELL